MATAAVARPPQTIRIRGPSRPSTNKRPSAALDIDSTTPSATISTAGGEPKIKRQKLEPESYVHTSEHILQKHRRKPVSMTVHLHQSYFRFENQEGSWAYDSPMRFIVEHLRKNTVPYEILEDLFAENVPFYDGCLIVEIHNHRQVNGKDKSRPDPTYGGDYVKYSMHNYHSYITPSPFARYPQKAKTDDTNGKVTDPDASTPEKRSIEKEKDGPHITTIVLHPTALSRQKELEILARTRTVDSTGSANVPPTPSLSMPQPLSSNATRASSASNEKTMVDAHNIYEFEASVLLHTEAPLYLEPVRNPQEAQKLLDLLAHPLHSATPPSRKTRKKTTAQMAADDAQAAEAERRMLLFDERIKPSMGPGSVANESQVAATSLGISRFKSIQFAKEQVAERESIKKAKEAQAAAEKRQQDEAQAEQLAREAAKKEEEQKRALMMTQRKEAAQQAFIQQKQQAQMQAKLQAQQQAMMNQSQAQTQSKNMVNQAQSNMQNAAGMAQNSPIVRQNTPMVNSSPMLPQGFSQLNGAQSAGSPPRPASAAMPGPMARQASQQQLANRNNTPNMPQGTPNMSAGMPNRAPSQTPRMGPASPVPGTPVPGAMSNMMHGQLSQEQIAMLRRAQMNRESGHVQGSPGQGQSMTPGQIQQVLQRNQQAALIREMQRRAQNSSDPAQQQHARQFLTDLQQHRQAALSAQQAQNSNLGQAANAHLGSRDALQASHSHPQQQQHNQAQVQMRQMQQAQQLQAFQHGMTEVQTLAKRFGGIGQVPQHMWSVNAKFYMQKEQMRMQSQNASRAQAMARQAQMAQNTGQPVVGAGGGNPEYMQQLRNQQAMLMMAQQSQQAQANSHMGGTHGMQGMDMNANMMQQFDGSHGLDQQFAAMQNALNQQPNGMQ